MNFNTVSPVLQKLVDQDRTVIMSMDNLSAHAFGIIGSWQRFARRQKWTPEEVKAVTDEMMSGNYDHVLQTFLTFTNEDSED